MNKTWFSFLILALVSGAVAGVFGALGTESYLARYGASLEEEGTPPRLGDERSRATSGDYREMIARVEDRVLPALVRFHETLPETPSIVRGSYQDGAALGTGIVVSSDGWILTSSDVFRAVRASQMTAVVGGNTYAVVDAVEDVGTEAMLVKVEATNLPVVSFGVSGDVRVGDPVVIADRPDRFIPTGISEQIGYHDLLTSSEVLSGTFLLSFEIDLAAGAAVANEAGELIGYRRASGEIRPLEWVLPSVRQVLRGEDIARPELGVDVVMLDRALGHDSYGAGALVTARPAFGTPAREADLRVDDVLLQLNGRDIGGAYPLSRLLLEYKPGDMVTLLVERDAERFDIDVTLGTR